ncbi:MAG TPA: sugar phosphate nucleotidyltransferase [Candidatus Saccharimonadales bacterium]|nr:sugar phosphate nucleotidyltransferase [Candidatus Saccharimonadales bacterium]
MSKPVTKAVIAAAGFGTRFLPQTKAMPKEMLPLVDKPIIQCVVEELVEAGIKDIIIVTGYSKRSIEDHFDAPNQDLIANLKQGGRKKEPFVKQIEAIANLAKFAYIRQKGPYGTATPVINAAHLLGNEPFIYTFADDFFVAKPGRTRQLMDVHDKYGGSVLACRRVTADEDYDRYGFVAGEAINEHLLKASKIIEKPGKTAAPSDLASVSGYLLTPDIFSYIERCEKKLKRGQEFFIQPAMQAMMNDGKSFFACEIQNGSYHDTGNKLEYLKTVVEFALKHDDVADDFRSYLRDLNL